MLDDYIDKASHCENPFVVRNPYTGEDILCGCGVCNYCITRKSSRESVKVSIASSKWKYSYFITLTYDNDHMPLLRVRVREMVKGEVIYSDDGFRYSSDTEFLEHSLPSAAGLPDAFSHSYQTVECLQVQGTVPFNRKTSKNEPIQFTSTAIPADMLRLAVKACPETPWNQPDSDSYLPVLNYYDVQNYIKRVRINLQRLGCNEKIHFYAAGEYGPVHFRPHYHILLFGNSESFAQNVRQAHNKSWTFGRTDIQLTRGGASSYVASYITGNSTLPLFYRQSKILRPKSRSSVYFSMELKKDATDSDDEIAQAADYIVNGKRRTFGDNVVESFPSGAALDTLCPRFYGFSASDTMEVSRIIASVANIQQRLRLFVRQRKLDEIGVSTLAVARDYLDYLLSSPSLSPDDCDILHIVRLLPRFGRRISSRSLDYDRSLSSLYRLFIKVRHFVDYWHLPDNCSVERIHRIIKPLTAAIQKKDYNCLVECYALCEDASLSDKDYDHTYMFLPKDIGLNFSDIYRNANLESILLARNASHARALVKHKSLNDANGSFSNI